MLCADGGAGRGRHDVRPRLWPRSARSSRRPARQGQFCALYPGARHSQPGMLHLSDCSVHPLCYCLQQHTPSLSSWFPTCKCWVEEKCTLLHGCIAGALNGRANLICLGMLMVQYSFWLLDAQYHQCPGHRARLLPAIWLLVKDCMCRAGCRHMPMTSSAPHILMLLLWDWACRLQVLPPAPFPSLSHDCRIFS